MGPEDDQGDAIPATAVLELVVVLELEGVGLVYADDPLTQRRYAIDRDTVLDSKATLGQRLRAAVNSVGYVLSAVHA